MSEVNSNGSPLSPLEHDLSRLVMTLRRGHQVVTEDSITGESHCRFVAATGPAGYSTNVVFDYDSTCQCWTQSCSLLAINRSNRQRNRAHDQNCHLHGMLVAESRAQPQCTSAGCSQACQRGAGIVCLLGPSATDLFARWQKTLQVTHATPTAVPLRNASAAFPKFRFEMRRKLPIFLRPRWRRCQSRGLPLIEDT